MTQPEIGVVGVCMCVWVLRACVCNGSAYMCVCVYVWACMCVGACAPRTLMGVWY